MGWSDEVHARRTLELRRQARKAASQAPGSWQAAPVGGNAGTGSLLLVTGVMAGIIVWRREGRHLRSSDIKKIPYVGNWLAEHVPRWRDNDPRKRAATAAERRARVTQRAAQSNRGEATDRSSVALTRELSNEEASTSQAAQQQPGNARKPRARKRSKRK